MCCRRYIIYVLLFTKPHRQCLNAVGWVTARASGPLITEWWRAGMVTYLSGVRCKWLACGPVDTTATPLCFSKIQTDLSFWCRLTPGGPGQRAVESLCVCACVLQSLTSRLGHATCLYHQAQNVVIIVTSVLFSLSCWNLPEKIWLDNFLPF